MTRLSDSLSTWSTEAFPRALKSEIEALPPGSLPLNLGTTQGGMVDDADITATVLRTSAAGDAIEAHVGIFFSEIVGGCSCGDEPLTEHVYCELRVTIDRSTAEAQFVVVHE